MRPTVFFSAAAAVILLAGPVKAAVYFADAFQPPAGSVFSEDLIILSRTASVAADCRAECIALADTFLLDGTVGRDLIVCAVSQNVRVQGSGDAYLLGDKVSLSGNVSGAASLIGRDISVSSFSAGRTVRIAGGTISLNARVSGPAVVWGQDITVSGTFGNLVCSGRTVTLLPGTVVEGDFVCRSSQPPQISPSVKIRGATRWDRVVPSGKWQWVKRLFSLLSLLLPFCMMVLFAPNLLSHTTQIAGRQFFRMLATGIPLIAGCIIGIALCIVSVVGLSIGLIASSIFLSCLYLARPFPVIALARYLLRRMPESRSSWLAAVFVGVAGFELLTLIPFVSMYVNLVCMSVGFAALVSGRLRFFSRLRREGFL